MRRFGQVGIAISALGVVVALMGLFPQLTGFPPTPGIGLVQVLMLLFGQSLLMQGAIIYIKTTFYWGVPITLAQSIGLRLCYTGILFASLAGLADILGFGSHPRSASSDLYLGSLQALGIILSFAISALGVLIYAVAGKPAEEDPLPPSTLDEVLDRADAP
ncbi:MAG: hypothetical protein SNJ54_17520 [Anaerolineae bacterium]